MDFLARGRVLGVLGLYALWAAILVAGTGARARESAAMVVNENKVIPDEFRWFMEQQRSAVFQYCRTRHHLEDGTNFWNQEVEGTTPKAMLQSNTVARIVREKVEQMLFRELGLLQDISYAAFRAQVEQANMDREAAAREGRVVYGPVRYTPLQFYEHRKATLQAQAREILAAERWRPKEEELRQYHQEQRQLFRAWPTYSLEVATIEAEGKPTVGENASAVQSAAKELLAQLKAGGSLSNIFKTWPENRGLRISAQRFDEVNPDRLGEMFADEHQSKAVQALAPREAAVVSESDTRAQVVRCQSKTTGSYRPFEATQQQVRERWLAQKYDRHIAGLASLAKVRINQKAIDAVLP
jgi:hypothetical protein